MSPTALIVTEGPVAAGGIDVALDAATADVAPAASVAGDGGASVVVAVAAGGAGAVAVRDGAPASGPSPHATRTNADASASAARRARAWRRGWARRFIGAVYENFATRAEMMFGIAASSSSCSPEIASSMPTAISAFPRTSVRPTRMKLMLMSC